MTTDFVPTVVIGGGVTGLGAALQTGANCLVLEESSRVGGTSRSQEREGFLFDDAGHLVWSGDGPAQELLAVLLGENLYFQSYQVAMHTGSRYLPALRARRRPTAESLVPIPGRDDASLGALCASSMDARPDGHCLYPRHGGMQAAVDALAARVKVRTGSRVTRIDVRRRAITVNGTAEIGYDRLITTMPLPTLAQVIPDLPGSVREALAGLVHLPLHCVYLAVDHPARTDKHRLYYPDGLLVMYRVTVQSNLSPHAAPQGTSSFIVEITGPPAGQGMSPGPGESLCEQAIADLVKAGLIGADDDILVRAFQTLNYAYPLPGATRADSVALVTDWLRQHDIYSAGRVGSWTPLSWGGALLAGRQVAQRARAPLTPRGVVGVPQVPARPQGRPAPTLGPAVDGPVADVPLAVPVRAVPRASGTEGKGKQQI